MASVSAVQTSAPTYNIEKVQNIVAGTTNNIAVQMLAAVIQGGTDDITFKQLAERHIIPKLKEQVEKSDQKTQNVYQKLFKASFEHIQRLEDIQRLEHIRRNVPSLFQTLAIIIVETNNKDAGGEFLGSFVYNATAPMIAKLEAEQPGAVDDAEIWK